MNRNTPSPRPQRHCCWLQQPLAPCELAPEGRPGVLWLLSSPGNGVIRFDDVYQIQYRLGADDWHIVGYTVSKVNGKEFEFDGLLPRAEAIVAAVEELDPTPPIGPLRGTGDVARDDLDPYGQDFGSDDAA